MVGKVRPENIQNAATSFLCASAELRKENTE
jgi:hypothetical protein